MREEFFKFQYHIINSEVNLIDLKGDLTGWIKIEGCHYPRVTSSLDLLQ
jgi:hypothetical protein